MGRRCSTSSAAESGPIKNFRAVLIRLRHMTLESTVWSLDSEVDDAVDIAGQTEI